MNFEAFLQITQTTLNMTRKIAYYSLKQRTDSDLSLLPSSIHTTSFMDGRLTGSEEMHHTPCHCHPLKPFIVIHCFTIMAYYVSQSLSALKKTYHPIHKYDSIISLCFFFIMPSTKYDL